MSRTRNTRPMRARTDAWRPKHDHRFGPCDLPPKETWLKSLRGMFSHNTNPRTRCHWEYQWFTEDAHDTRCSCPICTNHYEVRAAKKRERRWFQSKEARDEFGDE